MLLPLGWFAGIGLDGPNLIRNLLRQAVPSPVVIDEIAGTDNPIISQIIVAENGETILSIVDKLLDIIDWRILLDGDGTIHISPKADKITTTFDYRYNDILEMDVTIGNDWYSVPNVYRVTTNDDVSIATDEDPDSPFSIQNRGREIWAEEGAEALMYGETLNDYAKRRLKEAQNVHISLDYTRRFDPNIRVSDYVEINYYSQNISGIFQVKSQSLTIGYGGHVDEQVEGI